MKLFSAMDDFMFRTQLSFSFLGVFSLKFVSEPDLIRKIKSSSVFDGSRPRRIVCDEVTLTNKRRSSIERSVI